MMGDGTQGPFVQGQVPGPKTRALAARLRQSECAGITYLSDEFPVFWDSARGANVWDVDGNRYVDLTAAFGVAACGHAHPELVQVAANQNARLMHGMGDVHPPAVKVEFLDRLRSVLPGDLGHIVLGQNGADAVEAALKAAYLHTQRPEIIAFEGAYHGLSGMALDATAFDVFREPFSPYVGSHVHFVPYPREEDGKAGLARSLAALDQCLSERVIGAIVVEPIQGRGGVVVPPAGFLKALRERCDGESTVLILDEIFTGFSRTGKRFALEHEGVVPDLMCLGKALTGGFPLSACAGTTRVMSSWPASQGEAIHTSTFLGNPVGCALGIRSLELHTELNLEERAAELGAYLREKLLDLELPGVRCVRGQGLMIGVELEPLSDGSSRGVALMGAALRRGVLVLPSGPGGHVLSLTPPLVITQGQVDEAVAILAEELRKVSQS